MKKGCGWLYDLVIVALCALILYMSFCVLRSAAGAVAESVETRRLIATTERRIAEFEAVIEANEAALKPRARAMADNQRGRAIPTTSVTEGWYIPALPLDKPMQKAVFDAACEFGVDYFTALGLIKVESGFRADAVNPVSGCYGPMQLNPAWFPSGLSPEENVWAGMEYLSGLIERYDWDVPAALRAYNRGFDDGDRRYSNAVLEAAGEIMEAAGVSVP